MPSNTSVFNNTSKKSSKEKEKQKMKEVLNTIQLILNLNISDKKKSNK